MFDKAGIINILKPPGMTSFDAVNHLKYDLEADKAGHTGTLDPLAAGVLPICINRATKIIPFLPEDIKVYHCEILLGKTTDTLDREGKVVDTSDSWGHLSRMEVKDCLKEFQGEIEQIPPMYSAVKKDGRRLYELARNGREVERDPRTVKIYEIEIIDIELPILQIKVRCGSGTYIRSLARDLGKKLGCGGMLNFLIRTGSGPFKIENSLLLQEITECDKSEKQLISPSRPLNFPEAEIKPGAVKKAINGANLNLTDLKDDREKIFKKAEKYQSDDIKFIVRGPDGLFISISQLRDGDNFILKPKRVFNLEED